MALLNHLQSHSENFVAASDVCMDATIFGLALNEFFEDLQGQLA